MSNEYLDLSIAIVKQACDDYEHALLTLKKMENKETAIASIKKQLNAKSDIYAENVRKQRIITAQKTINDCERFFGGRWYSMLCAIDPNVLVRRIKEKVEENIKQAAKK